MEFNWTTFALEILNFLILVWILQHFLYKPVMDVIAARRANIEKTLNDAKALETEAQALKNEYLGRQAVWQQERDTARAKLVQDMAAERERLMAALEASLAEQREKARILEERKRDDWQHRVEERAVAQSAAFASRLLARVAEPGLEGRLIDLALGDLERDPPPQVRAASSGASKIGLSASVTSAYPIDAPLRARLEKVLSQLFGSPPALRFSEDRDLLAGIRVSAGSWVVHANLNDELKFFADAGRRAA